MDEECMNKPTEEQKSRKNERKDKILYNLPLGILAMVINMLYKTS